MRNVKCTGLLLTAAVVFAAWGCSSSGTGEDATQPGSDTAQDSQPSDTTPDATPDTVEPDTVQPDTIQPDVQPDLPPDIVEPDVVDVIEDVDAGCTGQVGCPCEGDSQCMSGSCLLRRDGTKTCALPCTTTCPAGYACSTDKKLCVEKDLSLCDPCESNSECSSANLGNACVATLGGGFCGTICDADADCPAGFACATGKDVGGQLIKQCQPKDGGTCTCSGRAIELGLDTKCGEEGSTCIGTRSCGDEGLTACDVPAPATETCDGVDNDCDGKTDGSGLCDDGNPCTTDLCGAKGCENKTSPNGVDCDDGDACTKAGTCQDGKCASAATIVCDDKNGCTDDSCDPAKGCVALPNAATCTDGDACTTGEQCSEGKCQGETDVVCDDGNVCTIDSCDPASGCKADAALGNCSDNDACTLIDTCKEGVCVTSGTPDCDDGTSCTDDSCDPTKGCIHLPNATTCTDGDACTQNDACKEGKCAGGEALKCDDNNACTADSCDKASGCINKAIEGACSDGDACTESDVCKDGKCESGTKLKCDDNNACTDDSCDKDKGCVNANNAATCSDGDACTESDACKDGKCAAGAALKCGDDNVCTDDSCDKVKGCVSLANSATCTDGDGCTEGDKCAEGKCAAGAPKTCDDANPCTDDSCKDGTCVNAANVAQCDDGNPCTEGDKCADSKCVSGPGPDCSDDNPCTADKCDEKGDCTNTPAPGSCEDGDACTENDACDESGNCQAGTEKTCDDDNVCTTDACDSDKGCTTTPAEGACDDGNACTENDACAEGKCGGSDVNCDDGNACTNDACDSAAGGCVNDNNTEPCDDGDACTENDACADGGCQGGSAPNCDDGNPCTADACDSGSGCYSENNTDACDDGNACTENDACMDGGCQGGNEASCDDGNACTNEVSCDPTGGCVHENNTEACEDGSVCTENDACADGSCAAGSEISCDDSNPCTVDSCDATDGCKHTPKTCDAGFSCVVATGECSAKVLISEMAAFGGAAAGDEFIELYNPGDTPASLKGLKVEYGSSGGTTWQTKTGSSGLADGVTIKARGYFLITGTTTWTGGVTPDFKASGDIGLSGSAGVVQLSIGTTVLDQCGYGSGTTRYEGTGPATVHTASGTGSMERKALQTSTASSMAVGGADEKKGNGYDGNDNKTDFIVRTARDPQNSASATEKP